MRTILSEAMLAMVDIENVGMPAPRTVAHGTALAIMDRSLARTGTLPDSLRQHLAFRDLSDFISLSQHATSNLPRPLNTDLLPISNPMSTAVHAMSAASVREHHARWASCDPRITDLGVRALLASALAAEPGSAAHTYYLARLDALPPGTIPVAVIPASLDALTASFGDGNSSAARSARARMQRRDRYGRFAWMGGGMAALVKRIGGMISNMNGRLVAQGGSGNGTDDFFDVEMQDGRIARIPAKAGEGHKAYLPDPQSPDGFSVRPAKVKAGDPVINEEDLVFVDAPNGYRVDTSYTGPGKRYIDDAYAVTKYDAGDPQAPDMGRPDLRAFEVARIDGGTVGEPFAQGHSWADAQGAIYKDEPKRDVEEGRTPDPIALLSDAEYDKAMREGRSPTPAAQPQPAKKRTPRKPKAAKEPSTPLEEVAPATVPQSTPKAAIPDDPNAAANAKMTFDVPDGAYAIDPNKNYVPKGRRNEAAEDYTDDPAALAQIYNKGELTAALEEALQGNGKGELSFDGGEEMVPAEALAHALRLAGGDPHAEIARIYDGMNGGSANADRLHSLRNGAAAPTPTPEAQLPKDGLSFEERVARYEAADARLTAPPEAGFEGPAYRGIVLNASPELIQKINDLMAAPQTDSEADKHLQVGQLILDEIAKDPRNIGMHWTTKKNIADIASGHVGQPGGKNTLAVRLTGHYANDALETDPKKLQGNQVHDEGEVPLREGGQMRIVGVELPDFANGMNLLPDPVNATFKPQKDATPVADIPAAPTSAPAVSREDLPAAMQGMSDAELAQFAKDGDYGPWLHANDALDVPDGYYPIDEQPAEALTPEARASAGWPDAVYDNPYLLAQLPEEDLVTQLREALQPGPDAGYGRFSFDDGSPEGFEARIPAENIRDALQLQGANTNELIQGVYDEGGLGDGGVDDSEAARILDEIARDDAQESGPTHFPTNYQPGTQPPKVIPEGEKPGPEDVRNRAMDAARELGYSQDVIDAIETGGPQILADALAADEKYQADIEKYRQRKFVKGWWNRDDNDAFKKILDHINEIAPKGEGVKIPMDKKRVGAERDPNAPAAPAPEVVDTAPAPKLYQDMTDDELLAKVTQLEAQRDDPSISPAAKANVEAALQHAQDIQGFRKAMLDLPDNQGPENVATPEEVAQAAADEPFTGPDGKALSPQEVADLINGVAGVENVETDYPQAPGHNKGYFQVEAPDGSKFTIYIASLNPADPNTHMLFVRPEGDGGLLLGGDYYGNIEGAHLAMNQLGVAIGNGNYKIANGEDGLPNRIDVEPSGILERPGGEGGNTLQKIGVVNPDGERYELAMEPDGKMFKVVITDSKGNKRDLLPDLVGPAKAKADMEEYAKHIEVGNFHPVRGWKAGGDLVDIRAPRSEPVSARSPRLAENLPTGAVPGEAGVQGKDGKVYDIYAVPNAGNGGFDIYVRDADGEIAIYGSAFAGDELDDMAQLAKDLNNGNIDASDLIWQAGSTPTPEWSFQNPDNGTATAPNGNQYEAFVVPLDNGRDPIVWQVALHGGEGGRQVVGEFGDKKKAQDFMAANLERIKKGEFDPEKWREAMNRPVDNSVEPPYAAIVQAVSANDGRVWDVEIVDVGDGLFDVVIHDDQGRSFTYFSEANQADAVLMQGNIKRNIEDDGLHPEAWFEGMDAPGGDGGGTSPTTPRDGSRQNATGEKPDWQHNNDTPPKKEVPILHGLRGGRKRVQQDRGDDMDIVRGFLKKYFQGWDKRGFHMPRPKHRIVSRTPDPSIPGDAEVYWDKNGNVIRLGDIIAHRRNGELLNPRYWVGVNMVQGEVIGFHKKLRRNGKGYEGFIKVRVISADNPKHIGRKYTYAAHFDEIMDQPDLRDAVIADDAERAANGELTPDEILQKKLWDADDAGVYEEYLSATDAHVRAMADRELRNRNLLRPHHMAEYLDMLDDAGLNALPDNLGWGHGVEGRVLDSLIKNEKARRAAGISQPGQRLNIPHPDLYTPDDNYDNYDNLRRKKVLGITLPTHAPKRAPRGKAKTKAPAVPRGKPAAPDARRPAVNQAAVVEDGPDVKKQAQDLFDAKYDELRKDLKNNEALDQAAEIQDFGDDYNDQVDAAEMAHASHDAVARQSALNAMAIVADQVRSLGDAVMARKLEELRNNLMNRYDREDYVSLADRFLAEAEAAEKAEDVALRDARIAGAESHIVQGGHRHPEARDLLQARLDALKARFAENDAARRAQAPEARTEAIGDLAAKADEVRRALREAGDRQGAKEVVKHADDVIKALNDAEALNNTKDIAGRDAAMQRARDAAGQLRQRNGALGDLANEHIDRNSSRFAAQDRRAVGGGGRTPGGWPPEDAERAARAQAVVDAAYNYLKANNLSQDLWALQQALTSDKIPGLKFEKWLTGEQGINGAPLVISDADGNKYVLKHDSDDRGREAEISMDIFLRNLGLQAPIAIGLGGPHGRGIVLTEMLVDGWQGNSKLIHGAPSDRKLNANELAALPQAGGVLNNLDPIDTLRMMMAESLSLNTDRHHHNMYWSVGADGVVRLVAMDQSRALMNQDGYANDLSIGSHNYRNPVDAVQARSGWFSAYGAIFRNLDKQHGMQEADRIVVDEIAAFGKRMAERAEALDALRDIDPALSGFLRERAEWFLDKKNVDKWIRLMRGM